MADVVITRSEYDHTEWTTRFELKFETDGVGYLNHRPGMFTDFNLGTPILQQSAPFSLDTSQFETTEQADAYYGVYPDQFYYDNPGGGDGGGGGGIQPIQQQQARLVKRAHAASPQRVGGPHISPWAFYTITGWRSAGREAGLVCGAAAGGCALASAIFAEAPWAPCTVAGCGAGVIYAAATRLRIQRR